MSDLLDSLSWLAAAAPPPEAGATPTPGLVVRWATVTQETPLRIRLDGDTAALPATPDSLVQGGLLVGQRCWVALTGKYIIIVGAKPIALDLHRHRTSLLGLTANDNSTWVSDPQLCASLVSGQWLFDASILSHCTDNGLDLSIGFYGHDSVVSWAWQGNKIGATSGDDASNSGMVWQTTVPSTMPNSQFINVGTGTWVGATRFSGVLNVSGPATVGLRFKKATAGSATLNIMHGSWIRLTKVS